MDSNINAMSCLRMVGYIPMKNMLSLISLRESKYSLYAIIKQLDINREELRILFVMHWKRETPKGKLIDTRTAFLAPLPVDKIRSVSPVTNEDILRRHTPNEEDLANVLECSSETLLDDNVIWNGKEWIKFRKV